MSELEKALRSSFKDLTKEELTDLLVAVIEDGLHRRGPKKKTLEKES